MKRTRTISSLIEKEYKNYSIYVCYHRAIPNLIDGFKISQRKAFYVIPKSADFRKVQAIAGRMISDAEYNHGDAAASDTISRMAQDFIGSNNIPVFLRKGTFGSRFIKKPSAPRYIYVKANPTYYKFFKDFELCPPNHDPENPEPEYYLPVIPTILLNGISGIAVGFATEIQPYNLNDIIRNIRQRLVGDEFSLMSPFFKGYTGEIYFDKDLCRWIQKGVYEIVNTTTIKITEIPTILDREKYKKHLSELVNKKLITSYVIKNNGEQWDITVKLPRASKVFNDPEKWFKLKNILTENITVIDENEHIICFNDVYELLDYFIKFRLEIYQKRIDYMMNKIKNDAYFCQSKIKFIIEMSKIDFKTLTKDQLKDYILKNTDINEEHLDKCFDIKSHKLNIDHLKELKDRIKELKTEFEWYKNITPKELFEIDLKEIEK